MFSDITQACVWPMTLQHQQTPQLAGVTQPPTQESGQPMSAIGMYVDSQTSILLQTCIALASKPTSVQLQEKHRVIIILDSGNEKTYIAQQINSGDSGPETNSKGEIVYQDIWITLQQPLKDC